MAEPVLVKQTLTLDEAADILKNKSNNADCQPICRPKAHQAFVFSASEDPMKKNDWRCDQYRWVNGGVTKLPRHQPVLKKHYFYADTREGKTKEFQRHAYQLIDNDLLTLVHYVGDETKADDFSHGNSKGINNKTFIRTCPSTLHNLKDSCAMNTASQVYKKEVSSMNCLPEVVPVKTP